MATGGLPEKPRLKKTHLAFVIPLTIVMGGVYISIWFLRRRSALNVLESSTKLGTLGPLLLGGGQFAFLLAALWGPAVIAGLAGDLFSIALGILVILLSFRVRGILLDHLDARIRREIPGASSLQTLTDISSIWTFFFQIWYLQHKINQYQRELSTPFVS